MKRLIYIVVALSLLLWACTASAGEISLAWDPSVSEGVVGYRVHVGSSSGSYSRVDDVGNITEYKVTDLRTGDTRLA